MHPIVWPGCIASRAQNNPIPAPMIEQQYLGGAWRIYFGLMWSAAPPRINSDCLP